MSERFKFPASSIHTSNLTLRTISKCGPKSWLLRRHVSLTAYSFFDVLIIYLYTFIAPTSRSISSSHLQTEHLCCTCLQTDSSQADKFVATLRLMSVRRTQLPEISYKPILFVALQSRRRQSIPQPFNGINFPVFKRGRPRS